MEKDLNNVEAVKSMLVKSRDEVKKLVSAQINAASSILDMEVIGQEVVDCGPFGGRGAHWVYDERQKEAFYAAYHQWDDFNKELFSRIFADTNNTDKERYEQTGENMFYSMHENYVANRKKAIREKLSYMEGFLKRLPLIPCKFDNQIEESINKFHSQIKTKKIFISHNTEDANYAQAIISMLVVLGVKHEDIFCSSIPGYGIPFGKNITDVLHNQFDGYCLFVIFIHSPRYYKSAVSLNEMGATWILRSEHRSFLTSDCSFSMLTGVINSNEIAFKAGQENTEHLLYDFREDIQKFFSLNKIQDAIWESTKKEFVEKVKSFQYDQQNKKDSPLQNTRPNFTFNDDESLIIGYLKQVGKEVKMSDISSNIGLTMALTLKLIRQLINKGIIEPTGSSKYAKYKLT